jgi:hypothetical protein
VALVAPRRPRGIGKGACEREGLAAVERLVAPQAPNARGLFLGDYMGLEAIGDDLLAFFATTQGDSANVYSVRANR